MEYRKRLQRTHPHLLIALNGDPERHKEVGKDSICDDFKRKFTPDSTIPQQQSTISCSAVQRQTANWYPIKKKVKVPPLPSQILQCPRPNVVPSFWCKICKVDCVSEFSFAAHIGGKKHKAKKLEIFGNRNTGVSVRVLGILCKIAMQSLEAETVNQMCLVVLFLQAVICHLEDELME
ncbi:hypothetical protein PVAP13_9KG297539 [Panicum virgatum]|uniref:U1-type domain-containing protein n=1 Tax=Panicum virgatum TaxID=38727 RepID=A0A8T0NK88_PANVG|nr:hypothetical protein PVAP13_9KG297539 [Panicum virgatum]